MKYLITYLGAAGALGILADITNVYILDQVPIKSLIDG